jgi:DNA-binding transcriptional LysR family regulator
MFLKQFQYLVALEREGHFGRAAERCFVSQPTLSSALKKLEDELNIPIILRGRKFEGFTAEGQCVVQWSKRLMADRAGMLDDLAFMKKSLHGKLRIGAIPTSSPTLPIVANLIMDRCPELKIDIEFMGINKLNNALKNFELDIGITVLDEGLDSRLKTMPLYEEPLHLLLPNNNWSNENPEITWIEASSLPLCLLSKSMRERQIIDEVFAKVGFSPEPQLESNSIFQLALFVAGGQLATIVPKRFTDQPGYCSKLLTNPIITQHVGLVWPEGDPLLPMTKAMIELMTEALDKRVFDLTGDQELPKKGCHIQQLSI